MKKYLRVLLILLCCSPAHAAITFVKSCQTGRTTGTSATCTFSGNTVAGNLLVCGVSWASNATITLDSVTHNSGAETLTRETTNVAGGQSCNIAYKANITGGATDVVATISSSDDIWMACGEFSGAATASVRDQINEADNVTADPITHGSITPGENNEMVFTVWTSDNAYGVDALPGTYTDISEGQSVDRQVSMYDIQTTATATSADIDTTTTEDGPAMIASFKEAPSPQAGQSYLGRESIVTR